MPDMNEHSNEPGIDHGIEPGIDPAPVNAVVAAQKVLPDFHESQLSRFNLYLTEYPGEGCNFWLGLASKGERTPQNVLGAATVVKMLDDAAVEGVIDDAPIMLSDTTQTPAQYLYLMPVPETDFRDRSRWIHTILETIKNWNPETIGIYLHPAVINSDSAKDLLGATLTALIESTRIKNYYLLVGSHGVNALINTALKVKTELETADREVVVFH